MRNKAAIVVSVVLGLLAVLLMMVYVNSRESDLLQLSEMRDVYVAAADILPNTMIDERLIQRIQVPANYLQPTAMASAPDLVGRVVSVGVPRGAQILASYLEGAGATALSYEVPRGRRAVTIAVSDVTGVGGLVRPGNYVDILGTFEFGRPVSNQGGVLTYAEERVETRTMLQNVPVIAVNQEHRLERAAPRTPDQALAAAAEDPAAAVEPAPEVQIQNVTVLVGPREVQQLVLAQQIGTLTLALRSNLDAGQTEDLGTLDPLGLLNIQVPVKARATPVWREFRGGNPF
jgi:pilus assembly protein CpaB